MKSNLAQRCGRKTLGRVIVAAWMVSSPSITLAEAYDHSQTAKYALTGLRSAHNLQLSSPDGASGYHFFVMTQRASEIRGTFADELSCMPGETPNPDRLVVDPVAADQGQRPKSLDEIVSNLRNPAASVIFLRSGVHHLSRPVMITEASGALTIRACPGETPVIEAPANGPAILLKNSRLASVVGLVFAGPSALPIVLDGAEDCLIERNTFLHGDTAITLDHAQRNQIARNVIRGVASTGIELKDGSNDNVVADNIVDGANAQETFGGGIFLHGTRDNRITHNTIQQTAGFGIAVSNWDDATINLGNIIEYNLLRRTVLNSTDSGAIYVLGRSGVDTGIVIAGNVIDGFGSSGNHNVGIYLDDSTSGAMVVGNLVRAIGSDAVQIHGGQDNLVENNLFDLGTERPSAVLFQAAPADTNPLNRQTGNTVSRNVVLSLNASPRPFVWYNGGTPAISGNFYVSPAGAVMSNKPAAVDQHPQLGEAQLLPSPSQPEYAAVQIAAERAIGFRPIDLAAAGVRRNFSRPLRDGTAR